VIPAGHTIDLARGEDLGALAGIERAAAQLLAGRLPEAALERTVGHELLEAAMADGRLWVARAGERTVGFALVIMLTETHPHLEEVDVHPEHARQGLGAALVEEACAWTGRRGFPFLTLMTFRDVVWNMPFYARHGFVEWPAATLTPELRHLVRLEASHGLDPKARVVMVHRPPAAG
jgi:GNAT superfamily N-acetyltransferase